MDITPRIRAEVELEKEANKFRVLYDLAVAMTADHSLDENLSMVVEQSRKLLGFDTSYIALRDESAGDVYMHSLSGITTEAFKKMRLPFGSGLGGKVAQTQKGVVVSDYSQEVESPVHDIVRAEGLTSGIAVPIQMGQRNLGVLYGFNRVKTSFSKSDLDTLSLLGNLAAVEIIRKRQEIDLREARDDLEQKVEERTAKLTAANEQLKREILERKMAEDALHFEKKKFETLSENAPFAMVMIAKDGTFQYANPKFKDLFGYELSEVPNGKSWFRQAFPDDAYRREIVAAWIHDLNSSKPGEQRPRIYSVTCKDGTEKIIHFRPVQLETAEHLVSFQDITQRTKTEQAIQERERFLSGVFASIQDGISVLDTELNVIRVNPTMETWYPHAIPLTGKKCFEAYHAQGQPCESCPSIRTLATGQSAYEMVPKRGPSGEITGWLDLYSFPLIDESTVECKGVIEYVRDISERKAAEEALRESEKKYRTILETIADGYHEVDLAGNLTLVNDSMCEIFGYPREELLGVNYRKLMDEDNAGSIFEAYNKVYITGVPNPGFNYQSIRKDGSKRDVSVSISLIKDSDGQPQGFRGIMRDITERKSLQEQLYQAAKMEAIGTLAGGLAHDFNNLLQIVLGYADLIAMDKENQDKDLQRARLIRDAAMRGRDLVNRILTFSRKVETKPRPIELNHELRQVEHLLRRTISKMIEIELHLARDLRLVDADPTQIEQILLNLALNAAHAMPEGGKLTFETANVRLDQKYCATHLETKPGEYVLLAVSDTGHGMQKEILDRIFEPFFTTKDRGEGTGLGLSMVFGIVKSHGGHISCRSKPGFGTVFKIYFPATETEISWNPEATMQMPSFGTETILLVDDEEAVRDLGKETLTSVGYKVLTASTGREALDLYAKARGEISLAILDLMMPEMGGKQCLEELLKINPQLKVLIASGLSADLSITESVKTSARGFISKPFRVKELLQQVRKVLDSD
jgi:two-component system cell cycle sensor histidine kinase/response regulator CckA